ncbi:MAG TPA: DUF2203 domain-containing protein [Candidatus Acidoferrales bacterium]|nr:DUF2203 domain-containing protein [Candidatus Acidoferrales bacterium]
MGRFYDIDAANERLVELRPLLEGLRADRDALAQAQREFRETLASDGAPGSEGTLQAQQGRVREIVARMEQAVAQVDAWGITLRDIQTGLVDFPALVTGRQVWLCWRLGEGDVAWWHELSAGVRGRRPLIDLA